MAKEILKPKSFYWLKNPTKDFCHLALWGSVTLFLINVSNMPFTISIGTILLVLVLTPTFLWSQFGVKKALTTFLSASIFPFMIPFKIFSFGRWIWHQMGTLAGIGWYTSLVILVMTLTFMPYLNGYKVPLVPVIVLLLFSTLILPVKWCTSPFAIMDKIIKAMEKISGHITSGLLKQFSGKGNGTKDFEGVAKTFVTYVMFLKLAKAGKGSVSLVSLSVMSFIFVFCWTMTLSILLFAALYRIVDVSIVGGAFQVGTIFTGEFFDYIYFAGREMIGMEAYGITPASKWTNAVLLLQGGVYFYMLTGTILIFTTVGVEVMRSKFSKAGMALTDQISKGLKDFSGNANINEEDKAQIHSLIDKRLEKQNESRPGEISH